MANVDRSRFWVPSRREMLAIGIGGFVAAVPFARQRPLTLVRRNVLVMGTIAKFAVAHRDQRQAEAAIDAAVESLRWVDQTMTRFSERSDVGRANLSAAREPVVIGAETAAVLEAAIGWANASEGAFDPCLARVICLWDVNHRHEPPAPDAVRRFANRHLYRSLEIDSRGANRVVRVHDEDAGIDLGGIAKGYAVDRAVSVLRARGIEHALVGAAGDLYALGRSPAGEPWRVGIQSPDDPNALAGTMPLEDAAVSTSGTYEQFFEYRGTRYHHLLDTATGAPKQGPMQSVTVTAATCMDADAGATAVFDMPREAAERILARRGARLVQAI